MSSPMAAPPATRAQSIPSSQARDAFYACLEKEADKKPTEIATVGLLYPAECKKSRTVFVNSCRPTWVKHFDRQYCAKKRVQRLLDSDEAHREISG
ncbi:putative cytochrome c oxidase, subunit VIb [Dioscorea sansibarensis]